MNKAELIDVMAKEAGISKSDAKRALEAFVDTTTSVLKKGEKVSIVGFGAFSVTTRSARTGRNPRTREEIAIPAKNVVKFKPGSELAGSIQ